MQTKKKRPVLWLVLTALLVVVCRCDGSKVTLYTTDNHPIECQHFIENASSIYSGIECKFYCNGFLIPYYIDSEAEIQKFTLEEVTASACGPQTSSASVTEEPTDEPAADPTEEPTEEPTDLPPLQPFLTGNATSCFRAPYFVNFSISPNAPDPNPTGLEVTFGDVPVKCEVISTTGAGVLSCPYPPGTQFPVLVSVRVDGTLVNQFTFDGAICTTNPIPKPKVTEDPSNPNQPNPPDCSTPTNDGC